MVNHEAAKVALVLAAVDPRVGGVALLGGHGTCKSTLARALRALLPRIETVRGSAYNADPNERTSRLRTNATDASVVETEIRDAPFLTIPLGATEDAVLGSVDLERSADSGEAVFSPGILARANRGVLFLDSSTETARDCSYSSRLTKYHKAYALSKYSTMLADSNILTPVLGSSRYGTWNCPVRARS